MKNWVLGLCGIALFAGCASAPKSEAYSKDMSQSVEKTLAKFTKNDEALQEKLDSSAGYVVFPLIVRAGAGLGYGYGEGAVMNGGDVEAYTTVNDFNIAFQWGAHGYSLLIVFDEKDEYEDFMKGNFEFGAGASAVLFPWGLGVQTRIGRSSVYFFSRGGLMFSANVDGLAFSVAKDE